MRNLLIFLFLAGSTLLLYNHGTLDNFQSGSIGGDKFRAEKIAGHPERSRPERDYADDVPTDRYHSR